MRVVRGDSPTTKHKHNLHDTFNRIYINPSTLAGIGIDHVRIEKALTAQVGKRVGYRPGLSLLLVTRRGDHSHT
jgi:hypothetical protein